MLLSVEALEDRTTPSVVFNQTYNWSNMFGAAEIEVLVTEEVIGGDEVYLWEYAVTNDSENFWDFGYFALPAFEPDPNYSIGLDEFRLTIGNLESTQSAWEGEVGEASDPPPFATDEYIWWEFGDDVIEPGQSAGFSFRTAPTTISFGQGIVKEALGIANTIIGTIAAPVAPKPWIVTTKSDSGDDSLVALREAADYVIGHQDGEKTVTFDLLSPVVTVDQGQITLGKSGEEILIKIQGLITIQSSGTDRIFDVLNNTLVELVQLDLVNGKVAGAGGAVRSSGGLIVTECTFSQNEATRSLGGAIAAMGGSLTVTGLSRFTGNSANLGGAVYIKDGVDADISHSEFVLNTATDQGGAIYILSSSTATPTSVALSDVDVNGNSAANRGGGIMVSAVGSGAGTSLVLSST